jgi:uncharacterized protein (TIGR04255 family)
VKQEAEFRSAYLGTYPKFRHQLLQGFEVHANQGAAPTVSATHGLQAFQALKEDEKQLVQMRTGGFSFNRLAPYSRLDDYLDEMKRTWDIFAQIALPVKIHQIQLRYINRLLLPSFEQKLDLDDFFRIGPKAPDEDRLGFVGFLSQYAMVESATGNRINTVLATQPMEDNKLPVIFDITAQRSCSIESNQWDVILEGIHSLRALKNLAFERTLTKKCLTLFQPQ